MELIWFAALTALFVAYALGAARLQRAQITGPMTFAIIGIVAASMGLPNPLEGPEQGTVSVVMTLTLSLLLFADASTIDLRRLRRDASVPLRLLLIGLPLTVVAGMLGAQLLLPGLGVGVALLIGSILAPTDVSLGLVMFGNKEVPGRVRQAINVESGLNDGLAAPVVSIAIAVVIAETEALRAPLVQAASALALGVVAGVLVGVAGGILLRMSHRATWSSAESRRFASFGLAVLAYVLAGLLGGNGFVAAFIGGLAFGALAHHDAPQAAEFSEEIGTLLTLGVWLLFGIAIGPVVFGAGLRWEPILYALLSLTLFRMLPVSIAMWGTGWRASSKLFVGWFGPRGLASVIFLLDAVIELGHKGIDSSLLLATVGWTVLLSVFLHGATSEPVAIWYAKLSAGFRGAAPELEPAAASSVASSDSRRITQRRP